MSKWMLVVLLGNRAHSAASFLVPLDERSQREFGGLLRWLWPWADGDAGPLGRVAVAADLPFPGLLLATLSATLLGLAALATAGFWVPLAWLRPLAAAGTLLLVCLMALFVGPTKLTPIAFALATLYVLVVRPATFPAG